MALKLLFRSALARMSAPGRIEIHVEFVNYLVSDIKGTLEFSQIKVHRTGIEPQCFRCPEELLCRLETAPRQLSDVFLNNPILR